MRLELVADSVPPLAWLWLPAGTLTVAIVATVVTYGELSAEAFAAVLGGGCLLAAVGLARRSGSGLGATGRDGLPWLLWLALVALWELFAFVGHDRLPTLSDLADPVLAHSFPRGISTLIWLAGGFWLITRPASESQAQ